MAIIRRGALRIVHSFTSDCLRVDGDGNVVCVAADGLAESGWCIQEIEDDSVNLVHEPSGRLLRAHGRSVICETPINTTDTCYVWRLMSTGTLGRYHLETADYRKRLYVDAFGAVGVVPSYVAVAFGAVNQSWSLQP